MKNYFSKIQMAKVTSEVVGKPYQLGGFGTPGFDCLSLILWFARRVNPGIDQEYEGLTATDYADIFNRDPDGAKQIMWCWISDIAEEVPRPISGDIVLIISKNGKPTDLSGSIYVDNGLLMTVFNPRGVSLISMKLIDIVKVFRICQPPS
jgi:hypothetical protein